MSEGEGAMTDEEMRKTYYGGYRNPGQSLRGAHVAGLRAVADAAKAEVLGADREALALHLWDEGLVRPESLGALVIDAVLERMTEATQ